MLVGGALVSTHPPPPHRPGVGNSTPTQPLDQFLLRAPSPVPVCPSLTVSPGLRAAGRRAPARRPGADAVDAAGALSVPGRSQPERDSLQTSLRRFLSNQVSL